jgi:hypothetical protein
MYSFRKLRSVGKGVYATTSARRSPRCRYAGSASADESNSGDAGSGVPGARSALSAAESSYGGALALMNLGHA